MNSKDTANHTYTELSRIRSDISEDILCESEFDNPNELCLTSTMGIYEPECYTYDEKNKSLVVYGWTKIQ